MGNEQVIGYQLLGYRLKISKGYSREDRLKLIEVYLVTCLRASVPCGTDEYLL
jgi:hypothetical protein